VSRSDPLRELTRLYDGPIPSAELAAARWGAGAGERLRRGADAALIEARLKECVAMLSALRRAGLPSVLDALARAVGRYRRLSMMLGAVR